MKNQAKSVIEMCRGGFIERVDYEVVRLMQNIADPNTKATAKRKLTITITLEPDNDRQNIAVWFETKVQPAPTSPLVTMLYVTGETDGLPNVYEMTPQIPGQLSLDGDEQEYPPMLRLVK